ncbi:universal stress protein [uncultured Brevundimonas sp.]|uniref:universal stress protein n=1 Tax=uncultured Brevundimonas sp. TaxID=213418 RepID=UPI00260D7898|nr:universal stress protein [uncultured Brevundimonas sp.]
MTAQYREIAVFADATPEGEALFLHAARLTLRIGADLVSVYGAARSSFTPDETFARGEGAIADVLARHTAKDRETAAEKIAPLKTMAATIGVSCEFRLVWSGDDEALRFLACDLMVAAYPAPNDLPSDWTAERLMSLNGGPMLLLPAHWPQEEIGRHVVVAWNGSRQARRAVTDALPFLKAADRITVLVVDAERYIDRAGAAPGPDLLDYLACLEVRATLHAAASGDDGIAAAIVRETRALDADLVVIGCYSRSRTLETIFGGVTRTLLHEVSIPLFLSF